VSDAKLRKLKRLLETFHAADVDELEIESSFWRGTRVRVVRRAAVVTVAAAATPDTGLAAPAIPAASLEAPATPPTEELHAITSPMVGTFYRAASPDAEPLVREGDRIRTGQIICIIEAMKIMNEVPADVEGEVVAVLASNAEPVEYGQPLFRLRRS
jgi:acetyl-CoA carboxylase biotin carboxyl carrier protein